MEKRISNACSVRHKACTEMHNIDDVSAPIISRVSAINLLRTQDISLKMVLNCLIC